MIYFVQEKGLFRSRVKIGFTDNIKNRLSGLRVGSPSVLKLVLLLPGTTQDEAGYHERFASYRLHGEWFSYGLKLRLFVWANQFGTKQVNPEIETNSELEPKLEPEMEPVIEPNREPEPITPTDDEIRTIAAFVSVRDSGKFSWRKATKKAYDGRFGEGPNKNLRATLDKFGIDYSEHMSQEETQEEIISRLNSEGRTRQEIAEYFGYQSNGGHIYRKMKKVLG